MRVSIFDGMGRGIESTKHYWPDEVIHLAEILILNEQDTIKVNETELKYYTFKYNDSQDCLVLGLGEIFNHSDNANIKYELIRHEGRTMMQFTTIREIQVGEQLFINYNADVEIDKNKYFKNKSLID